MEPEIPSVVRPPRAHALRARRVVAAHVVRLVPVRALAAVANAAAALGVRLSGPSFLVRQYLGPAPGWIPSLCPVPRMGTILPPTRSPAARRQDDTGAGVAARIAA